MEQFFLRHRGKQSESSAAAAVAAYTAELHARLMKASKTGSAVGAALLVPVCGVGCGCQVSTLDVGGVGSWVLLLWPAMLGAAHSSKQLMGARSSRAVAQLQVLH